jgi:protein SCO1
MSTRNLRSLLQRSWPLLEQQLSSRSAAATSETSLFVRRLAQQSSRPGVGKGPVSFKTLLVTLFAGAGIVAGARAYEQTKVQNISAKSQQVVGKAAVGGPFRLIDQDGKPFTDRDLLGEFSLLYFGFTYCPDICPDELEKMMEALDVVEKKTSRQVLPVFISVDPERDTPKQMKEYVTEFHPRLIGLTGDLENVKKTSKLFRVYYHKTDEGSKDYLVDHSIIMYLMDPNGEFVTFYGKNYTMEQLSDSIAEHITKWRTEHPEYGTSG